MLEFLLQMWLLNQLPTAITMPIGLAGIKVFSDIYVESERMEAVMDDCIIYTCDYTDYNPEWFWGDQKGNLNFHELIGASPEIMINNWHMDIKQIPRSEISTKDYTLTLYFRDDMCVRADYWRPCDRHFCDRYGKGNERSFHLYSELIGDTGHEVPIDFEVHYYDLLDNDMLLQVKVCGGAYPYVIENKCQVSGADKIKATITE